MPFNERGEWVTYNPLVEYKEKVLKSKQNPGSGGILWTSEFRNQLHNAATLYVMDTKGIPNTPDNFQRVRNLIGQEIEEDYEYSEQEGLLKISLPEERSNDPCYPHIGD